MPEIKEIRYLRHDLPRIKEFLRSRTDKPELSINTMPDLNDMIFGLRRKEMVVIGARTSEGKSAFASQLAFDFTSQGHKVLFLSLETTIEKIGARLFCYEMKFDNIKAFRGGTDWGIYEQFENKVKNYPIIISDMLGKNWQEIDELISTTSFKPDVVIVDYIQTIAQNPKANRLEEINEYIRHFREMAIRQNFCGIVCSQINRSMNENGGTKPQLHQLKNSGFLEEHSDVVLLLSWPHKYGNKNLNLFEVFIAKNKDGQTGYKKLNFEPQFYLFSDFIEEKGNGNEPIQSANWTD